MTDSESLTEEELRALSSRDGLLKLLRRKSPDLKKVLRTIKYEKQLEDLQVEMVRLSQSVQQQGRRVVVIFEGRDAAGKGGAIRRFTEHLSPRSIRVIALPKPSDTERGQWYFRRYAKALPNPGEIGFFDRSWYNRAVVEPVMGFCNEEQHERFMLQVNSFEEMLIDDGVEIIKLWFDISKGEQAERFAARRESPLKQWKISSIDEKAQDLWDDYSHYRDKMFRHTSTKRCPWTVIDTDRKKTARIQAMRHVLLRLDYEQKGKGKASFAIDKQVVLSTKDFLED